MKAVVADWRLGLSEERKEALEAIKNRNLNASEDTMYNLNINNFEFMLINNGSIRSAYPAIQQVQDLLKEVKANENDASALSQIIEKINKLKNEVVVYADDENSILEDIEKFAIHLKQLIEPKLKDPEVVRPETKDPEKKKMEQEVQDIIDASLSASSVTAIHRNLGSVPGEHAEPVEKKKVVASPPAQNVTPPSNSPEPEASNTTRPRKNS